ncbi:hypothetical protein ACIQ9Q_30800 [Streptomyces sp. NPDC094438]|uniref:hypothetical protein n=1 Tax=Streptomyces sp. NPDC094438 TaxID=3366061 RepID=UPI0038201327
MNLEELREVVGGCERGLAEPVLGDTRVTRPTSCAICQYGGRTERRETLCHDRDRASLRIRRAGAATYRMMRRRGDT